MKDHFIPCLLLAGFCVGRSAGRKSLVWQLTSNGPHPNRAVPAEDLAHADRFYEHEDFPDLDEVGLHDREKEAARLIRDLVEGQDPGDRTEEVARFVSVVSARTAALRSQFQVSLRGLLNEFANRITSAEGTGFLARRARESVGDGSIEQLLGLGIPSEALGRAHAAAGKEDVLRAIRAAVTHLGPGIARSMLDNILDGTVPEDATRKGQMKGLHGLVSPSHDRADLRMASWSCISSETSPFVLGDGCVVAVGAGGAIGWPGRFGPQWQEIYLPIHQSVCLVGLAASSAARASLSPHTINEASARLARRYIYASRNTGYEADLAQQIGTSDPMFEDGGLKRIVDELFREGS